MIMKETVKQNENSQKSNFRKNAIKQILSIKRKIPTFTRCSQFLAISILDKFQQFYLKKNKGKEISSQDAFIYSIACLFLACKFNGKNLHTFQKFINQFCQRHDQKNDKSKIIEAEAIILQTIDFQIPIETAFTILQDSEKNDNMENSKSKVVLAKCLKILLLSVQINSTLTQNPIIGDEIYCLVKNRRGTRRAIQVYQQVQMQNNFKKSQ